MPTDVKSKALEGKKVGGWHVDNKVKPWPVKKFSHGKEFEGVRKAMGLSGKKVESKFKSEKTQGSRFHDH